MTKPPTKKQKAAFGLQFKRQARTNERRKLREAALATQGGKCYVCGKPVTFENSSLVTRDEKSVASCKSCAKEN